MTPSRSVLVSNLPENVKLQEVKNFMSNAGKITNIQLDFCDKSSEFQRSAALEFENMESVLLALGLNGSKLQGCPIVIHPVSRKDQLARYNKSDPLTVRVGNLSPSTTVDQLSAVFSPFGRNTIKMMNQAAEITYFSALNGLAAIRETHKMTLNGSQISVEVKSAQKER